MSRRHLWVPLVAGALLASSCSQSYTDIKNIRCPSDLLCPGGLICLNGDCVDQHASSTTGALGSTGGGSTGSCSLSCPEMFLQGSDNGCSEGGSEALFEALKTCACDTPGNCDTTDACENNLCSSSDLIGLGGGGMSPQCEACAADNCGPAFNACAFDPKNTGGTSGTVTTGGSSGRTGLNSSGSSTSSTSASASTGSSASTGGGSCSEVSVGSLCPSTDPNCGVSMVSCSSWSCPTGTTCDTTVIDRCDCPAGSLTYACSTGQLCEDLSGGCGGTGPAYSCRTTAQTAPGCTDPLQGIQGTCYCANGQSYAVICGETTTCVALCNGP